MTEISFSLTPDYFFHFIYLLVAIGSVLCLAACQQSTQTLKNQILIVGESWGNKFFPDSKGGNDGSSIENQYTPILGNNKYLEKYNCTMCQFQIKEM